jgi:lysophospholipase L1-like esterase
MLASFRRRILPFLLITVVTLVSFGLCPSSYASSTANLAVVAPYDTIVTGQGNWGLNAAGFREFLTIGNQYRIRQDGTIKRIRLYVDSTDGLTGLSIRIWRKQTEGYSLVGSSEDIHGELSSGQTNVIDLAGPIANVQEGDYYGCRIEKSGSASYSLRSKTAAGYDSPGTYYIDNAEPSSEGFQWEAQSHDDTAVPIELYMDSPDYVFIGDSIISGVPLNYSFINGWSGTDIESTIERQFADLAHCTYQNMGLSGDTMLGISGRTERDVVGLNPRVVVAEGGVNDILLGPYITKDEFLGYWKNILDDAMSTGIKVVVIPILPLSYGTYDQMVIRDDWNKSLVELVSEYQNADLADASAYVGKNRPGGPEGNLWDIQDECSFDRLHFTAEGHRRIASAILDRVQPPSIESASFAEISAGDTVTIVGTHFRPARVASRVFFDGREASDYLSWSDTEVRVRVPSELGPGTTRVTVETLWGTSEPFEFNLVPTITTLSPSSKIAGQSAFTLTVNGTNFVSGLSVVRWNGTDRTTTYVSATQLTASIPASDIAWAGIASVNVFNPTPGGGTSGAQTFTVGSPSSTWYLPEGTTAWGFSTYITIENPNDSTVNAKVIYMPFGAANKTETITLPASSQTTLTNDHLVSAMGQQTDFSTEVECLDATKTIAVDRTMTWTGPGAPSEEAHSSVGVTSPAKTWYLPEGSCNWGFETWLLIQNPNTSEATCQVTYMIENEGPKTVEHKVDPNSRATFDMSKDIGAKDASIKVVSDIPVIPERSMYRNNRREGHDSIGTTTPANDYYLAEGATGYNVGYITWVLVQNPQDTPTDVTLTYMTQGGQVPGPSFQMQPNSRKSIRLNDQLPPNTDVSTRVHGSAPIIAERAMYWGADAPLGEACHDSIGMDSPHSTFYLPDGETYNGMETWTLVQNPNKEDMPIEINYLLAGGGVKTFTDVVKANSRKTFFMADVVPNGRAAIMVKSKTAGKPIMVERAMYWNSRGAGTDTIGGFGD